MPKSRSQVAIWSLFYRQSKQTLESRTQMLFFLILEAVFLTVSIKSWSGSTIWCKKHYKTLTNFWSANHTCRCDHCKRSIFWFHENVEKLKYAQNAYQKHICARPKRCRIAISFSGEHSVPIFEKCAWNTHQIVISRFLHFCAKNECASGTRLVHVLWFLMIFTKFNLFENLLETLTRTTFPVCTRDCCLRNVAVAADFCKTLTPALRCCSDCLKPPCETHKKMHEFSMRF